MQRLWTLALPWRPPDSQSADGSLSLGLPPICLHSAQGCGWEKSLWFPPALHTEWRKHTDDTICFVFFLFFFHFTSQHGLTSQLFSPGDSDVTLSNADQHWPRVATIYLTTDAPLLLTQDLFPTRSGPWGRRPPSPQQAFRHVFFRQPSNYISPSIDACTTKIEDVG